MGRSLAPVVLRAPVATLALAACYTAPELDVGPQPAGVTVESRLTYYDVTAATLAELRRSLSQDGPRAQGRTWGAVTNWYLSYTYQNASTGANFCELRRPRVRVRAAVTFPRWNPSAEPDSLLLTWWQQYNAGLAEHERGHASMAVRSAGELVKALEGIHASCSAMATQANLVFQRHMFTLRTQQEDYDRSTRHGATQIQAARRLQEP